MREKYQESAEWEESYVANMIDQTGTSVVGYEPRKSLIYLFVHKMGRVCEET